MRKINDFIKLICYSSRLHIKKYPYIYGTIFTFSLLTVTILIPFIINESYKKNVGYYTLWEAKDLLSFYGSFLAFSGTVALGALAIFMSKTANNISKNANALNEKIIDMEKKDRKTFISIDKEKKLTIFFNNEDPLFLKKMLNKNVNFHAHFIEDTFNNNDIILFEFYLKNISSNYATGIYLDKFEIQPEFDSVVAVALECDADNSNIIEPAHSYKTVLTIIGLETYLEKKPIDYIGSMCDFSFEISVSNLYDEETNIIINVFAELTNYNENKGEKSFNLSFNDFIVVS